MKINCREKIESIIPNLPHYYQVQFAYYCANDVRHLARSEASHKCLELVKLWLEDKDKVSPQDLNAAAYAAYATANVDDYSVAYATANAANAAYATANAAYAAFNAANAAAYDAFNANTAKHKQYYEYLIRMINEIPGLEILLWTSI